MTVVASNYARKENDLYQTEPWATAALLRHYPLNGESVWEPAAGNHLIADVLAAGGSRVLTSDIATYDRSHDLICDFLKPTLKPHRAADIDHLITNPPYGQGNRQAVAFAEYALTRCKGLVALLLTAKFDFGNTRTHLFRDNRRFAAKITLIDRIQWFPGATTGTEDHAWYVWGRDSSERRIGGPRIVYEGRAE